MRAAGGFISSGGGGGGCLWGVTSIVGGCRDAPTSCKRAVGGAGAAVGLSGAGGGVVGGAGGHSDPRGFAGRSVPLRGGTEGARR